MPSAPVIASFAFLLGSLDFLFVGCSPEVGPGLDDFPFCLYPFVPLHYFFCLIESLCDGELIFRFIEFSTELELGRESFFS